RNYFAIEDATAGRLPFLVEAGSQENALYVEADSDVGLGTAEPATRLHVVDSDSPTIRLEQDNSAGWGAQAWDMGGNEDHFFIRDVTSDTIPVQVASGASNNTIYVGVNGSVGIGTTTPTATLHIEGDLHVTGNLTQASDRNLKENIIAADNQAVLDQLLEIPVYYWNYTADERDTTHLGPMAQDFHASSQLGSDTTISNLDINGALIASVQALHTELENKDAEIETLTAENDELKARLEALEAAVGQILADHTKNDSEE
ncbi:MAG: tail fiber domain-containing protein, partial [Pseudomonadota bacterium]